MPPLELDFDRESQTKSFRISLKMFKITDQTHVEIL